VSRWIALRVAVHIRQVRSDDTVGHPCHCLHPVRFLTHARGPKIVSLAQKHYPPCDDTSASVEPCFTHPNRLRRISASRTLTATPESCVHPTHPTSPHISLRQAAGIQLLRFYDIWHGMTEHAGLSMLKDPTNPAWQRRYSLASLRDASLLLYHADSLGSRSTPDR
jgi:hypothetical protein